MTLARLAPALCFVTLCCGCVAPTESLPGRSLPVLVQKAGDTWSLDFPVCAGESVVEVVLGSSNDPANPNRIFGLTGRSTSFQASTSVRIELNAETAKSGEFSPELKIEESKGSLDIPRTSFSIYTSSGYAQSAELATYAGDLPVVVRGTREFESAEQYDPLSYCSK